MRRGADRCNSGGVSPGRPYLIAPGLAILAQFDDGAALDGTEIERLTGCLRAIARRYLVMLCGLGYLTVDHRGAYRLVNAESGLVA
jgi:DNA-binding IclR family transcriptional regulator